MGKVQRLQSGKQTGSGPRSLPRSGPGRPGQAELGGGDYNSQQHLQQPRQPGFPPDTGQVAMLTGAPGAYSTEAARPRQ